MCTKYMCVCVYIQYLWICAIHVYTIFIYSAKGI